MLQTFLHFLHLLSLCCFFGGITCVHVLKVAGDNDDTGTNLIRAAALVDRRVVAPAAILLTLTGFALAWHAGMRIGMNWVTVLAISWISVALVGVFYLAPCLQHLALNVDTGNMAASARGRHWNAVSAALLFATLMLIAVASFAVHG